MFNSLVWSGDFPQIPSNFNISLLSSEITIYKKRENVHTTRASILFLTLLTSTSVQSSMFQVSASRCFILAIHADTDNESDEFLHLPLCENASCLLWQVNSPPPISMVLRLGRTLSSKDVPSSMSRRRSAWLEVSGTRIKTSVTLNKILYHLTKFHFPHL